MLHRCKTTFFRYSYTPILPVLLVPARCQSNIPSRSHVVDAKVIESLTCFNVMSFCRSKGLVKKYREGWAGAERGWVMRF